MLLFLKIMPKKMQNYSLFFGNYAGIKKIMPVYRDCKFIYRYCESCNSPRCRKSIKKMSKFFQGVFFLKTENDQIIYF